MKKNSILVIGALGQVGTELVPALIARYGAECVLAADVAESTSLFPNYVRLDILDDKQLDYVISSHLITQIYLLAATLSAKGELDILRSWTLNVNSLLNVLEAARIHGLDKVFWPSSIAVFGPNSAKHLCPQEASGAPVTVYGISKKAGEYWCRYYYERYHLDVRSVRLPGLISHSAPAGGGTTDYAVDIFHHALQRRPYPCFLKEDTCLPMMYMPDAVRAILMLMEAPEETLTIRGSYNLGALSFAPCDLYAEILKHVPGFKISYEPDSRQMIADSWPASIDDSRARQDWGWSAAFQMPHMVTDMVKMLKAKMKKDQNHNFLNGQPEDNYVFTRIDGIPFSS